MKTSDSDLSQAASQPPPWKHKHAEASPLRLDNLALIASKKHRTRGPHHEVIISMEGSGAPLPKASIE